MRSGSKTTAPRSAAGALILAAVAAVGLLAATATGAAAVTPTVTSTAIVARINTQRAAHGIPQGTRTGPYLYLLPDGPWAQAGTITVTSASLSGPGGAVPLRIVDKSNTEIGPFLPEGGAMLIPLRPLRGGAAYTVTASLTSGTTTLTKRWRFATARENEVTQQLEVASATEFRVVVTSTAPEPAVTVDGKPVAVSREGALWQSAPLRIRGALAVCARSGGGTTGYVAATYCFTWRFS